MLELHNIISGFYAEPLPSTCMILQIEATIEGEHDVFEFVYRHDDPYGLSPDVTAWIMAHPEFQPEPYDPNRELG